MKNNKVIMIIAGVVVLAITISGIIYGVDYFKNKKELDNTNKELAHIFKNEVIKPEDDVYSLQKEADNKINEAMDNKKYTIDNPFVLENPYSISPLSAIVVFQTKKESKVTLEVNGKKYEFEESKKHAIPVYGLIAGKVNTITIESDNKSKKIDLDMSDIKDDLNLSIDKGKSVDLGNDIYVVTTPGDEGMFGFNTNGELVWRLTETFSLAITRLENGHLLLGNTSYIVSYSRTGLVEIDYLGKIYNVYDIDGGYHHDSVVLENGNIILGTSKINRGTIADLIIEIDPKNGNIVNEWDLRKIVNEVSKGFVESLNHTDWATNNSIYYDKETNSLILSLSGRNSIMSIDYSTKKINWIFGSSKYWNNDFKDYLVNIDSGSYPMGANTATINKDGNLVLFNNRMDGSLEIDSPCAPYIDAKSSGQIYKIENKKATLVRDFNDNNSFYSYAVSNYNELNNGNYLLYSAWQFAPGSMTTDSSCTMNQISKGLSSTLYETDKDGNILFKASLNYGSYRAGKVSLYEKENKNFEVKEINYYNTLDKDIYEEINTTKIVDKLKNAESGVYSADITKNLLTINAAFQNEDEVYVLLVGNEGKTYKYLSKGKGYYLQPIVNLRGIEGKYALFLVINDTYYNLDKLYEF